MASKTDVYFLILSDTHDFDFFSQDTTQPLRKGRVPEDIDVVLHCGDFTENGSPDQIQRAFEALGSIEAELKLLIAGNHETSLDREFFASQDGEDAEHEHCKELLKFYAHKYGVNFLEEGTYSFTLNSGATFAIYASPYTPEFGISAYQYKSAHDRYNPKGYVLPEAESAATSTSIIHAGTDIVMTHGPPRYVLDCTTDGVSAGCEHLRRAICRVKPKLHCFGHIHYGYGIRRIRWEEGVNAYPNTAKGHTITFDTIENYGKRTLEDESVMGSKSKAEDDGYYDGMIPLETFIGKGQAKKKGYAEMGRPDAEDFKSDVEQTLFVNAAIMDKEGKPSNPPWVVCLELPIKT
jgi:Icc-related predicted phosphoesterase